MKKIGLFFIATGLSIGVVSRVTPLKADVSYPVDKYTYSYVSDHRPIGESIFTSDIYFSQSYFEHSAYIYDSHLATASLCLAITTYTDYAPFDEKWYASQPKYIKEVLETIGFDSFTANDDFYQTARFDSLGLAVAKKKISDYTVIAVAPRSGGYYSEWANNMHLGDGSQSDYMHEGWYNASQKLINFVSEYIVNNQVTGRVKLWMTGFSRGGAVVNIAAGLLDSSLDKGQKVFNNVDFRKEDLYAYTFESPQGANVNSKNIKLPKDPLYGNIWNIINPNDVVTKVAMSEYGFTRFGTDKFITTKFFDPSNYDNNRRVFKSLHDVINQTDEFVYTGDNFSMNGLKIEDFLKLITVVPAIVDMFTDGDFAKTKDNTKANYDANIATTLFIEELTSNLGSRSNYVKKYQKPIEDLMLVLKDEKKSGMPSTPYLIVKMIGAAAFSSVLIGNSKDIEKYTKSFAGEYATVINNCIDALIGPICSAYWERPNELFSIFKHINDIFQNHSTDVVLAHLQAQDSYYIDAYNASHSDKIDIVPFRDNADFGRMKFFGFNDLGLRLDSKKGRRVVNVEGHVMGKSDVEDCDQGYAVGYYSYITEEKMELFMPIGRKYNISMKSYSKKPRHRCEYWAYYQFVSLDNRGQKKIQLDHKKDTAYFNSDRFKRDVTISV